MDPLSEMLTLLTVERAAQVRFESRGSYRMAFRGVEHVKFGAVLKGRARLWVEGNVEPLRLEAGDCYLLTDGRPYRTATDDEAREIDGDAYFAEFRDAAGVVRFGDGPPDKIVIGGGFLFDREGAAWLRAALPPIIHIGADSANSGPLRTTLALLRDEAGRNAPGETVIVDRLADVLLVQALRAHLDASGPRAASWLAGLADPKIGKALRAFHADVAAEWTIERLATAAAMSRSSFADAFQKRIGMAPLEYVTRWRMHRVRRSLLGSELPFATIAARNGYRSRTSCSKSFKRMFGCAPQALRAASVADADTK